LPGPLRKFLVAQERFVAELHRALDRDTDRIIGRPRALQVGIAPRRARRTGAFLTGLT